MTRGGLIESPSGTEYVELSGPSGQVQLQAIADLALTGASDGETGDAPAVQATGVVRVRREAALNVLDFAAVGRNSGDDYAAIAAAITKASTTLYGEGGLVEFPEGRYLVSQPVLTQNKVFLKGPIRASATIVASSSFPNNDNNNAVLVYGDGTDGLVSGVGSENISVDGNNRAALAVFSDQMQEQSGIKGGIFVGGRLRQARFNGAGVSTGGGCSSFVIRDADFSPGGATSNDKGVWIDHCDGQVLVQNCTFNGKPNATSIAGFTDGLYTESTQVLIINSHVEHCTNGVNQRSGAGIIIQTVGGPVLTTLIRSASGNLTVIGGYRNNGASSFYVDEAIGQTFTAEEGMIIPGQTVSGSIQLPYGFAPSSPAGGGTLFVRANGGGKGELCVVFPTGAVQVIKTEA